MEAVRNQNGLYTFKLTVHFKSKTKTLVGLVDTGSNICACNYKIPTTLRARQTTWEMITIPTSSTKVPSPGYSIYVGFDDRAEMTHVYRLDLKMDGIDFILGMSILSKCKVVLKGEKMEISWI